MIEWIYFSLGAILGFALGVYASLENKRSVNNGKN